MIKLVPIDAVQASEYNPRRNDEKRLALTELSLRKLGFLLPIYADESGEILSGHQRHLVASRMGFQQIPVEYVSGKTPGERRAVNVLFNRATNDLQKQDTCAIIRRRLYETDIEAMTGELPDIEPGSEASFPCVYALRRMDVVKLAKLNHRSFDTHIKQLAKSLERRIGSAMPVVIGEAGNVINGIGRLQVAAEAGRKVIACVKVRPEQEAFASSMLNLLSMDFDMESTYADDLRFNSAIFNHAVRYYNLRDNPCKKAGSMGKKKNREMMFWTKEQYLKFAEVMMDKPLSFYAFEMLYWCGIREGELLALTPADFDFEKRTVTINKSYQRLNGQDLITTPKTEKSNRVITMPQFLAEEIQDYLKMLYGIGADDRMFTVTKSYLHREMDRGSKEAGVPRIRIHDIRHSAVSLLIDMGFSATAIADRVGHESIDITYNYAHLFPSKQTEMADKLNMERGN